MRASRGLIALFRQVLSAESMSSPGLPPQRVSSVDYRPATGASDDGGLAAAAELLNFGTPRTRPTQMSPDVPPVPPLPQQYQFANKICGGNPTPTVFSPLSMHPLTQPVSEERDVRMQERGHTPRRSYHGNVNLDEDEDGIFRMEE